MLQVTFKNSEYETINTIITSDYYFCNEYAEKNENGQYIMYNEKMYTFGNCINKPYNFTIRVGEGDSDESKKPKTRRVNKKSFIPSATNCTVEIFPLNPHTNTKSYQLEDGSNGLVGRACKAYYKYIAKSICYIDETGRIFAPIWAWHQ